VVDDRRWERLLEKEAEIARARRLLETTRVEQNTLEHWLRRPEVEWPELVGRCAALAEFRPDVVSQVVTDVKYAGYVTRQEEQVARQRRLSEKRIPASFDYARLSQLRFEARQKLSRVRPVTLAQAGRISGITPADIALLLAHLEG
jgi:tRNA uridine 5-carboxymethylaminomethyl modification enzyme